MVYSTHGQQTSCNVPQDESTPKIEEALTKDGAIPSEKEMNILIMGDSEGQIPRALRKKFPALNKALASFF